MTVYDGHLRSVETMNLTPDVHTEVDGLIVRIVDQHRGFISSPRDLDLDGPELDVGNC